MDVAVLLAPGDVALLQQGDSVARLVCAEVLFRSDCSLAVFHAILRKVNLVCLHIKELVAFC